jgi:hypothetical protein
MDHKYYYEWLASLTPEEEAERQRKMKLFDSWDHKKWPLW